MKKIETKVRNAHERIRDKHNKAIRCFYYHAVEYLGKEFNTAEGYRLKGCIDALKEVLDVFYSEGL